MKVISQKAITRVKGNNNCIAKLMILFKGKHQATIVRWLDNKDMRLITPSAMEIITKETGLKESEILEEEGRNSGTVKIIRTKRKTTV